MQHINTSNHVEEKYQDLLLVLKLEVDALDGNIMIGATSLSAALFQQPE